MTHSQDILAQAEKIERATIAFGIAWENIDQIIEQVRNECIEISEALKSGDRLHLQEEVGDLIQAAISIAVFCEVDPGAALRTSIKKFSGRLAKIKSLAEKDGYTSLQGQSFDTLMKYWNLSKKDE